MDNGKKKKDESKTHQKFSKKKNKETLNPRRAILNAL
jgi:hypothetical protein